MRRYHPNNTQKDKKRYQRLLLRKQQVQNDMLAMILNLLSRHGNRINSYPVPDEDGCVEYPVSMTLYGKHNDPMISITSVYLDEANLLKADGVNESKCITECGFVLYPEHYSWTLDFIAIALGYKTQSE